MAEGLLIVEVYEYTQGSPDVPAFEYIPCQLSNCIKRGDRATLSDIVKNGFDALPRRAQNADNLREIMRKLEEANIGRINVEYHRAYGGADPYVELTNIVQVTLTHADMRRMQDQKDSIVLRGRYRMTEGNETTQLRDAQRLTLIYSSTPEESETSYDVDMREKQGLVKEIWLNITFLQE